MATTSKPAAEVRRGRRPGANTTRQEIMDAARARFASDGYAATTIRRIAADAGVNPSLVMQFFNSKEELFGSVMSISPQSLARFSTVFDGPDEHLGERVVRAHLEVWEGTPEDSEPMMAMLRGAIANEQAGAQLREFIQARLLDAMGSGHGERTEATLRAGLAASMLVGVVVGRLLVRVPILADADVETLINITAPAIQSVLTQPRTA